jgi:hypothetical protein
MRILKRYSLPVLIAGGMFVSGCASSQIGDVSNQTKVAMQEPAESQACPSKWIAAGNNGAKADRYFQVSCQ